MKYRIFLFILSLTLGACGTIKSFDNENNELEIKNSQVTTNCDEISHIYSGVRYDLCLLDAEKKNLRPKIRFDPRWLAPVDILFSGIADTVALPYTIFQQSKNGNLNVVK